MAGLADDDMQGFWFTLNIKKGDNYIKPIHIQRLYFLNDLHLHLHP